MAGLLEPTPQVDRSIIAQHVDRDRSHFPGESAALRPGQEWHGATSQSQAAASSKKFEALINADGQATLWLSPTAPIPLNSPGLIDANAL